MSRSFRSSLAALTLAVLLAPVALAAQGVEISQMDSVTGRLRNPESPITFVIDGVVAQPRGEFHQYVSGGLGLQAALVMAPAGSPLGLRFEGGLVQYGSETKRVTSPFGGRIAVDLTTSNDILMLGVGPQLMAPRGAIRPYVAGTVGFAAFVTSSSVEGANAGDEDLFNTTNHHDAVFAWTGSGGIYIPMKWGKDRWSIDLGVTYHGNNRATYLRKGDIIDNADGTITLNPQRSETRFLSYRIGVRIGS